MPGESAEYDLIRVLDSQADSKQDTFFIAPKEVGRSGSGLQVLTVESVGEPDAPDSGQSALFLDSSGSVKSKAPDGTVSSVGETLDPTTVDISELQNSDTKADLTQSGGVLVSSQIPSLSITSVTTVPDQTARLNLTAQEGDVAVQTDTGEAYVLSTNDPTVDSNWIEISIDVLSQIDGQQITPSQVGTSANRPDVTADEIDANAFTGQAGGSGISDFARVRSTVPQTNTRVQFNDKLSDPNNNFSLSANAYTTPSSGLYFFSIVATLNSSVSRFRIELDRSDGGVGEFVEDKNNPSGGNSYNVSAIFDLGSGVDVFGQNIRTASLNDFNTVFTAVKLG
jgi:hypothetical protein